jgi:hypothetical protein
MKRKLLFTLSVCLLANLITAWGAPLGTAFSYQGRLTDNGSPAQGGYDLVFRLYPAASGGSPIGPALTNLAVAVSNGLFTTTLDFGEVFGDTATWIELLVRPPGGMDFTPLAPRLRLSPTPYALHAANAGLATVATTVSSNSVGTDQLLDGAVTSAKIAAGNITASHLTATLLQETFWRVNGNAGTTAGASFVGTTDSQPLDFQVNRTRGLRLELDRASRDFSGAPNLIGGSPRNAVASGVGGGTVSGGDHHTIQTNAPVSAIGGGGYNFIAQDAGSATIAGGFGNRVDFSAGSATIGGGYENTIQTDSGDATIAGGAKNLVTANSAFAAVGGGFSNIVRSSAATIAGGHRNAIDGAARYSAIAGGFSNVIQSGCEASTIGGGHINRILPSADFSTIGGGHNNAINNGADQSIISGGSYNVVESLCARAAIGGGRANVIGSRAGGCTIAGGEGNTVGGQSIYATIAGGGANTAQYAVGASIGGGSQNQIETGSDGATIPGGTANHIGSGGAGDVIGGGTQNEIQRDAIQATIAGGSRNLIQTNSHSSTVGGGLHNVVQLNSRSVTIAGGTENVIRTNSPSATISGGAWNATVANAGFATIAGGRSNVVAAQAFAAGSNARATNQGAFVWSDATGTITGSSNDHSVTFRAGGGYRLFTGAGEEGVYLAPGSGTWTSLSDREAKENFRPVDARETLAKVAALPLTEWNYKSQDARVRHLGPTAQDFRAAFGVGDSDRGISAVDADGVALAAIQGLHQLLREKESEIQELKAAVAELRRRQDAMPAASPAP